MSERRAPYAGRRSPPRVVPRQGTRPRYPELPPVLDPDAVLWAMFADLPEPDREALVRRVRVLIRAEYRTAGMDPPPWLEGE